VREIHNKELAMKNLFNQVSSFVTRIDSTKIKFVLMIVTLALLVIGAGAPDSGGGIIGK
jgi:hypothetical protein